MEFEIEVKSEARAPASATTRFLSFSKLR